MPAASKSSVNGLPARIVLESSAGAELGSAASPIETNDAGRGNTRGVAGVPFQSADATTTVAITDDPDAGKKLVISDLLISSDTAMSIYFLEQTTSVVIFLVYIGANETKQITPRGLLKLPHADRKLAVQASVPGALTILAFYRSEA